MSNNDTGLPELPDDFSESKDWREGDYADRVLWLMAMVKNYRAELAALREAAPRVWTAENIGGAPEGRYIIMFDFAGKWDYMHYPKRQAVEILGRRGTSHKAFGPIVLPGKTAITPKPFAHCDGGGT